MNVDAIGVLLSRAALRDIADRALRFASDSYSPRMPPAARDALAEPLIVAATMLAFLWWDEERPRIGALITSARTIRGPRALARDDWDEGLNTLLTAAGVALLSRDDDTDALLVASMAAFVAMGYRAIYRAGSDDSALIAVIFAKAMHAATAPAIPEPEDFDTWSRTTEQPRLLVRLARWIGRSRATLLLSFHNPGEHEYVPQKRVVSHRWAHMLTDAEWRHVSEECGDKVSIPRIPSRIGEGTADVILRALLRSEADPHTRAQLELFIRARMLPDDSRGGERTGLVRQLIADGVLTVSELSHLTNADERICRKELRAAERVARTAVGRLLRQAARQSG